MSQLLSFSVGPSEVYPEVGNYLTSAFEEGFLSISHRSKKFDALSEATFNLLHEKLNIPTSYTILFTGSATESWEILAQSLTERRSTHIYTGSFGEKWFDYAKKIKPETLGIAADLNDAINPANFPMLVAPELLCLTHNETSNGTSISDNNLNAWREMYPESLIALDCTSSMAGVAFNWDLADVWFASVQKCFGLPAGLGVLILSPNAVAKAKAINENAHYNSLVAMLKHREKFQNSFTPNVLGIYLLNKVMVKALPISEIDSIAKSRATAYYQAVANNPYFQPLVTNSEVRSTTVIAVQMAEDLLPKVYSDALAQNFELGRGYGTWKPSSFRIANFPAISQAAFEGMLQFLEAWGR